MLNKMHNSLSFLARSKLEPTTKFCRKFHPEEQQKITVNHMGHLGKNPPVWWTIIISISAFLIFHQTLAFTNSLDLISRIAIPTYVKTLRSTSVKQWHTRNETAASVVIVLTIRQVQKAICIVLCSTVPQLYDMSHSFSFGNINLEKSYSILSSKKPPKKSRCLTG